MFYPFIMGINHQRQSGDRRDDIGDFALCVERDPNWPVFWTTGTGFAPISRPRAPAR